MNGQPGRTPFGENDINAMMEDNPMDIFGQGGEQGFAALLQNGGGKSRGAGIYSTSTEQGR
jgi:hypothetical protein